MPDPNPNNKSEPEDIFAQFEKEKPSEIPKSVPKKAPEVEKVKADKREILREIEETPSQEPVLPSSVPRKTWVIILIIVVVVVVVGGGIFIFGGDFFKKNENKVENENIVVIENEVENLNTPVVVNAAVNETPTEPVQDTDGDGLSDNEEKELGTNPNMTDTDNDGLFDKEEVKTYKTDPKNSDSDSDGIKDGVEVDNGYDPNGPGKLIDLSNAINELN